MISILIPTLNRSAHLARALYHYARTGFDGHVLIGDSSNERHARAVRRTVDQLKDKLKITYTYFPKPEFEHDGMCVQKMVEAAPTEFAVYSGDDDLLVTENLEHCARYLMANPEFSAAHGYRANVALDGEGPWTLPQAAAFIPGQELESDSAVERFTGYMRTGISMQYFVHRIETWRRMYQFVDQAPSRYLGAELLPCSLSAILGKVKRLDLLTTVFQRNNDKILDWAKTSMFDLVNQFSWPPSMEVTKKALTSALMEAEGISRDEAADVVHREIWYFVAAALQSHFCMHYEGAKRAHSEEPGNLAQILSPGVSDYASFRKAYLSMVTHPPAGGGPEQVH